MCPGGIRAKTVKKWQATTDSAHQYPVVPNTRNWQFTVEHPNRVWAGDITYVWTSEGRRYLAVVLDRYSRRVIAWGMGSGLTQELATAALSFHTLKTEIVYHRRYLTREEARQDIFEWIEVFYNRVRRHSTLGYRSPAEFEARATGSSSGVHEIEGRSDLFTASVWHADPAVNKL